MNKVVESLKNPKLFAEWETGELQGFITGLMLEFLAEGDVRKITLANAELELARRNEVA
jgi:hypothetical protein